MLEYPDAGRQSTGTAVHDRYYNLRGVCTNLVLRVEVEHTLRGSTGTCIQTRNSTKLVRVTIIGLLRLNPTAE